LTRAAHRWWLALGLAASLAALPAAAASVEGEIAFQRGVLAFGAGHLDEARREFESVLARSPDDREALRFLAWTLEAQGETASALGLHGRLVALDPGDRDLAFDRAVALLELGRNAEARAALARFLEEDPGDARAQLFAGIAAYRAGDLSAAPGHLRRAAELEASLAARSRYYGGLVAVSEGDRVAAENAFAGIARQSPASPLGRSAAGLAGALRSADSAPPWRISVDADGARDGSLALASAERPAWDGSRSTLRGELGRRGGLLAASARLFGDARLRSPAPDEWGLGSDAVELDLPSRAGWVAGASLLGPAREDDATALLGPADSRRLRRAGPALLIPAGDWSLASSGGPASGEDPELRLGAAPRLGVAQPFSLPQPFRYVTLGASGDHLDRFDPLRPDGRGDGFETSLGAGYDLPYEFSFSWLWRFAHRDYGAVGGLDPLARRVDDTHWLTAELAHPLVDHWIARLTGSFRFQDSSLPAYDQDRKAVGAYLTYEW